MVKRRVLRGKKLLVAAGIAGVSVLGCDGVVANLVAPPDTGAMDSGDTPQDADTPRDADTFPLDAPVANLLPPPDSGMDGGEDEDAGGEADAGDDASMPDDAAIIGFPDAPVANLLPPPDSGAAEF